MKFHLSVPSKTFLLGEYLALETGEALLVATQPRFELQVELTSKKQTLPFHKDSPAGHLLDGVESNFAIEFMDPHRSCGGFGRSSAEFLFALFLKDFKKIIYTEASTAWSSAYVLKMFRQATKSYSFKPSGADTLAQFTGGVVSLRLKQSSAMKLEWFKDLSFSLFHTGKKVPTHKHLNDLPQVNSDELQVIYQSGLEALKNLNKEAFLQAITCYRKTLQNQGLELPSTTEKIDKLLESDEILSAKGCGALGADVILCFHEKENAQKVRELAESLKLTWIADDRDMSEGFQFKVVEPQQ